MKPSSCRRVVPSIGLLTAWLVVAGGMVPNARADGQPGEYLGPCALAVSQDAKTLFVACADAEEVMWLGLPEGNVVRRVRVPAEPTGLVLAPDASKLIVTCAAPKSTITVLDAASGKVLDEIAAGHTAMSPAIGPEGKRVYVCNRFDNDVSVIDLDAGKEVGRVATVREPLASALTRNGRELLVANHLPNTRTDGAFRGNVAPSVTLIDTQTHATTAIELLDGANSLRGLCILPDGKHAVVTHLLSNFRETPFRVDTGWIDVNVVSIIDIAKRQLLSTIGLDEFYMGAGNPYDVTCSADGRSVCVSLAGTHELSVIDISDLLGEFAHRTMRPVMGAWPIYPSLGETLWRRIRLPGKGPRGLAVAGSKVYVAEYFSDTVAVVDLQSTSPVTRAPVTHDPVTHDPVTIETIALGPVPRLTAERRGELLFHDATLCFQHWLSCVSCHPDGRADALNWDLLNDGQGNSKNTKSMLLAHRTPPAMSEAVRSSAELAVRAGLEHILFADRPEQEAAAIDAYLKSLVPVPSPRLVDGRLSAAAQRGQVLFHSRRVACGRCHPPPLYTDLKMHDVDTRSPGESNEHFDTPTLVEVWRTAPYLHDGRYTTIKQLLVEGRHGLRNVRGDDLSKQEVDDLVEFLLSL